MQFSAYSVYASELGHIHYYQGCTRKSIALLPKSFAQLKCDWVIARVQTTQTNTASIPNDFGLMQIRPELFGCVTLQNQCICQSDHLCQ